ncbi:MAG: WGR domain-containing protein [Deltaproteobacteria bacterium]|nr:WGR domain-containing protein [Deltaproteobacteria bacterium]
MKVTLSFQEGTSNKFYTLDLDDKTLNITYGRIGSNGTTQQKKFKTSAEALKEYEKLLAEKKKKGYVEASSDATDAAEPAQKPKTKKAATPAEEPAPDEPGEAAPPKKTARDAAARDAVRTEAPKGKIEATLPFPALTDPPVKGLDLELWRHGTVPVPEKDPSPFPSGDFVIEGYKLTFGDDGEVQVSDAKGKKLKSVPDKLRKNEDYQALMRGRKDDRGRERKARRVLEDRMISGAPLLAEELRWFVEDDAFAPLLRGLVIHPESKPNDAGVLVAWDEGRGLGVLPLDYDAKWVGWESAQLAHPMRLSDLTSWQDLLVDVGTQQSLVQAFREVKTVPIAQRKLTESSMLSGRETSAASAIERTLMEDGWVTRRGMAKRKMALRTPDGVTSVEAWFDYGEYYMPAEPTTSGSFGFFSVGTTKPLKLLEVPDVLLSETIRSLDLCLAQAGAKKDEDSDAEPDGEESAGDGDDAASDD